MLWSNHALGIVVAQCQARKEKVLEPRESHNLDSHFPLKTQVISIHASTLNSRLACSGQSSMFTTGYLTRATIRNSNRRLLSLSKAWANSTFSQRSLHLLPSTVPWTRIPDPNLRIYPLQCHTGNTSLHSAKRHLSFGNPNVRYTRFAPGAGGKQRRVPTFVTILACGVVSYYLLQYAIDLKTLPWFANLIRKA